MTYSKQCNWPKKGGKIFIEGSNPSEFSYYGWGDSSLQFYGYIQGYKQSADSSIDYAIEKGANSTLDSIIFPVCFLYRHTLELQMKYIYLHFGDFEKDEKIVFIKNTNHNLMAIWNEVKEVLNSYAQSNREKNDIKVVESYINQFHQFDNNSFTFRYPINKELSEVLDGQNKVDLLNLKCKMNELYIYFDACINQLSEIKSINEEMESEIFSNLE